MEMLGGFGELGIFGDVLGPVIAEKEKKSKKKATTPAADKKKYKAPLKILFDSLETIEVNEKVEFTEGELFQKIADTLNCSLFIEHQKEFVLNKLKDGVYLLRPGYGSKCEKGAAGSRLLVQQPQVLSSLIEPDDKGEITVEAVKAYIMEHYNMDCVLHLIGDVYVPIPRKGQALDVTKASFPIKVVALTLFGEMLEIEEDDYISFIEQKGEGVEAEEHFVESSEPESNPVSKEVLYKVVNTYLPEYGDDLDCSYDEEQNVLRVMHKSINSTPKTSSSSVKKEETYPTDAVVSLVFTKIELSSALFDGKKEITKKELVKFIGKQYPEYSLERTEIQYDKKSKLIIPILKSGKRGVYVLDDNDEYRREESDLMSICVRKESSDQYGCMNGTVFFNLPQIPFGLLKDIMHFFWDVYVFRGTEALAQIYYDRNKEAYEVYVPLQEVSKESVSFERNVSLELDPEKILVMEIHSHGRYGACWSKTDNEEELSHRLYAVVGDLSRFHYDNDHIRIRAATGGYFVQIEPQKIFRYPGSLEEYHPEMKKVRMQSVWRNEGKEEE